MYNRCADINLCDSTAVPAGLHAEYVLQGYSNYSMNTWYTIDMTGEMSHLNIHSDIDQSEAVFS